MSDCPVPNFRPDLPAAIAVLAQFGDPETIVHSDTPGEHRVSAVQSGYDTGDAGRSIFRSLAERRFFEAANLVYGEYLVMPNVALHAALDFDILKGRLTVDERRYFFHALIDCVVFDPARRDAPSRFFELDGKMHDDEFRRQRDGLKDRIISMAGHQLIRIRLGADMEGTVVEFEHLLLELEADESAYIAEPESGITP
jgi:hypothetical protein